MWLALHFQVHGRETKIVSIFGSQLLLLCVGAHAQTTAHCGHLLVELLTCDFMVEAKPAEFDLHTEEAKDERGIRRLDNKNGSRGDYVKGNREKWKEMGPRGNWTIKKNN